MRFTIRDESSVIQNTDSMVVFVFDDLLTEGLDPSIAKKLSDVKTRHIFQGKAGEVYTTSIGSGRLRTKSRILFFVGLGKKEEFSPEQMRLSSGVVMQKISYEGLVSVRVDCNLAVPHFSDIQDFAQSMTEGFILSDYRFDRFKSKKKSEKDKNRLKEIVIYVKSKFVKNFRKGINLGKIFSDGTNYARDLINTPSNEKRPPVLATLIRRMAQREGLKCRILDEQQIRDLKMGAFLAVARGSSTAPRLVILEYGDTRKTRPISFIGKGITFDTGGISIKPSSGMENMTTDMSGAAAVFGAMKSIAQLKPKVSVVGIGVLAENMLGGNATRPGDIVRSMKGTTIEIHNTDAEGRLVLADGLHYAKTKYNPQCMINLATLTGACMVALGTNLTGMYGTHDELVQRVREQADFTGDQVWHMPLHSEFTEMMKGQIADLCNISGVRWGGANSAAAFLQHFTNGTPWVHLDIAGPSHVSKRKEYKPTGGTGVGTRVLVGLAKNWKRLQGQKGKAFGT